MRRRGEELDLRVAADAVGVVAKKLCFEQSTAPTATLTWIGLQLGQLWSNLSAPRAMGFANTSTASRATKASKSPGSTSSTSSRRPRVGTTRASNDNASHECTILRGTRGGGGQRGRGGWRGVGVPETEGVQRALPSTRALPPAACKRGSGPLGSSRGRGERGSGDVLLSSGIASLLPLSLHVTAPRPAGAVPMASSARPAAWTSTAHRCRGTRGRELPGAPGPGPSDDRDGVRASLPACTSTPRVPPNSAGVARRSRAARAARAAAPPLTPPTPSFLGAGKTTFLNWILGGDHGKKFAVVQNEFGRCIVFRQGGGYQQIEPTNQGPRRPPALE